MSDGCAVASETMKRARHNVQQIIERLESMGYEFMAPRDVGLRVLGPYGQWVTSTDEFLVWTPPQPADMEVVGEIEEACGRIPLALLAWYEVVGQVSLMGSHPALASCRKRPTLYGDPLEVLSPRGWFRVFRDWMESDRRVPFSLPVCGDLKSKAGESGSTYDVSLENWSADPLLLNSFADPVLVGKTYNMTLMEYLRRSFKWGGFPGWEGSDNLPSREIAHLSEGLLEI